MAERPDAATRGPSDAQEGPSPLYRAAQLGDAELASRLLALGADPDAGGAGGRKALHSFCESGLLDGVRILLEAGADPDAMDAQGNTPGTLSAGRPEALALLRGADADLSAAGPGGLAPAHVAAMENAAESLSLLARFGVPLDAPDPEGRVPLHYAARSGPESVEALLAAGADPSARDKLGRSPLFDARDPKSALALIEAGADPRRPSRLGLLPEEEIRAASARSSAKGDAFSCALAAEAATLVRARREELELRELVSRRAPAPAAGRSSAL